MRKALLFLIIEVSISVNYCIAQGNDSIDQVVYLIGNTATREIKNARDRKPAWMILKMDFTIRTDSLCFN